MRASSLNSLLADNAVKGSDPIDVFKRAINPGRPWDSIVDFATHPTFCGLSLYPRQETLLKLIYLETENMTAYDLDVIGEWTQGFSDSSNPQGVQVDIWDRVEYLKANGYSHFPHIQAVQGRRASKGTIGGVLGAERMAYFVSLDDPQAEFGLAPGKTIWLSVVATNSLQAKKFQFADVRETVERCQWLHPYISTSNDYTTTLRTNADIRRIAEMKRSGLPVDREIASVRAIAMSSTSSSGRGGSGFMNIYDEFAHMLSGTAGPRTSEAVYDSYQPSLDQFGKDAMTYIPSSPYTKVGRFYELYQTGTVTVPEYDHRTDSVSLKTYTDQDEEVQAELEAYTETLEADPEFLIIQLPSWGLYRDYERAEELVGRTIKRAIQYQPDPAGQPENVRMARLEKRDPVKFKVERRAQFAEVVGAYLDPKKVDNIFEPEENQDLSPKTSGVMNRSYQAHVDAGATDANFAYAIAHLEKSPVPDEHGIYWDHVVFDKLQVFRPQDYEDNIVDYVGVEKQIERELTQFRTLKEWTFDQWNSIGFIARLSQFAKKKKLPVRVHEVNFNDTRNTEVAKKFRSAINLGWVKAYKDDYFEGMEGSNSLLENELKFLVEKNGKVQKQSIGPVTTKDLADCVMEVSVRLLSEQLDNWQSRLLGTTQPATGLSGGYPRTHRSEGPTGFQSNNSSPFSDLRSGSTRGTTGLDRLRGRRM